MPKKEKKGRNKFLTEKITKKKDDDYKKRSLGIGMYDRRPILFFFFIFAHPCFFFFPARIGVDLYIISLAYRIDAEAPLSDPLLCPTFM